jgi:tetratricopeptide (TPR) repeat protein
MITLPVRRSFALSLGAVLAVAVGAPGCASHDKGGAKAAQSGRGGPGSAFESASADPPIASDTRFAAGQLAESHGALPQAAEQYRAALKANPKHVEAMYRLGIVYASMKKYPEAVEVWKRYIGSTNGSAAGYSNLGFCYELAGRPEQAEAAYQKGIEKDPRHMATRVNYGLMLVRRGRTNEGSLQLQAVLAPAEVRYNVGSVYESLGRKQQAKAEYEAALRLDPSLADAQSRLDGLSGKAQANAPMAQTPPPQPAPPVAQNPPATQTPAPQPALPETGVSQTNDEPVPED